MAQYQYSTPPIFPELDERRVTNDYGLVHLAMTVTKIPVFRAIVRFLNYREVVCIQRCRKVFLVQVEQAVKAEVLAGNPPIGFRFAVTKAATSTMEGYCLQIVDAAEQGKFDELLGFCQVWVGHPVLEYFTYTVMYLCTYISRP